VNNIMLIAAACINQVTIKFLGDRYNVPMKRY
jgi:hypothetical protein